MVVNDEERGKDNLTFHIPNVFSRQTADQNAAYQPLQREDVDDGQDDENGENEALFNNPSLDVENCRAWSEYTVSQKILVHLSFGILGAAVLLPFNTVITPSEFYRTLFVGSKQEGNFMSWIIILYNISSIIFGAHATVSMSKRSINGRILSSSILIVIVLSLMTLLTFISANTTTAISSTLAFSAILLLTCIISGATSYLQLAVVTLANSYGPRCLGLMLTGQGLVGACVSIIQLITSIANAEVIRLGKVDHGEAKAAVSFFATNTIFMVVAMGWFWKLTKTSLYREMEENKSEPGPLSGNINQSLRTSDKVGIRRYMSPGTEALYDRLMTVQSKVWLPCFSIAYIFIITLSVFPALTSRVRPIANPISTLIFVSWHFVAFNVSDLIGRTLPTIAPKLFCFQRMMLVSLFCVLRTILVPLLAMCNLKPSPTSDGEGGAIISKPFESPIFFSLIIVLGISNGLLATNTFILGPRSPKLVDDQQRSLTAGLLSWWLTIGLSIGSLTSFFISS